MYPKPVAEAFMENGVWYQDYEVLDASGNVVVKRYMHNGTEWVEAPTVSKIDFSKKIPDTAAGISLKKNVINLDKCLVNLSKSSGISLDKHRARVAVVLDYSGSMYGDYRSGYMQKVLTRLVPLGLRFDDNGELDVWLFDDKKFRMEGLCLNNFENYVKDIINNSGISMGGTCYAPVIEDIVLKYEKEEPSSIPAYIIFITDGENCDKYATDKIIIESAEYNIFIQFVGMGEGSFSYLEKLDDLEGRSCDNTGFIRVKNFEVMSDDELYNELLRQYVDWLKVKGVH